MSVATTLEQDFIEALGALGFPSGVRLAVAYSGGPDSTALLLLACQTLGPERVVALHVDHNMRVESSAEAKQCAWVAEQLRVRFVCSGLDDDTREESCSEHGPEGGLREVRYAALVADCADADCRYLATGHHADDAVETHLLALARGSGLTGLGGPRPQRSLMFGVMLLRPLLGMSRDTLHTVLGDWPVVDDPSNQNQSLRRNRVRHTVLPTLRDLAGSAEPLHRAIALLASDRRDLEWLARQRLDDLGIDTEADELDVSAAVGPEDPAVRWAVRAYLTSMAGGFPPSSKLVERCLAALAEPGRTRWIDTPEGRLRVASHRVSLVIGDEPEGAWPQIALEGERTDYPHAGIGFRVSRGPVRDRSPFEEMFDCATLPDGPLVVRPAREGDRFRPFGLGGSVRLYRWLASKEVPRDERRQVLVVEKGGEILWVVGLRRGDTAQVRESTEECLFVKLTGASPAA